MKIIQEVQGSEGWHAARAQHRCASDAPAVMGCSKYKTRTQLLQEKATGATAEISAAQQRLFDRGHETEDQARALVEEMLNEDLFPIVATDDAGYLLASFDGMNMEGTTGYEHKLYREDLAEQVRAGQLEPAYYWQLEQQILVGGLERVIFVTSDGTKDNFASMEYRAVPGRAEQLMAAWKQFDEDLANYKPTEAAPVVVASPIMQLPTLFVELTGRVESSNLALFKSTALEMIAGISTELTTDQHFADAESKVKFLKEGEEELDRCKRMALAKTASIEELFQTMDHIKETMRQKRLELDKLVSTRKDKIRAELIQSAQAELSEYVSGKNKALGKPYIPPPASNFTGVIKGKKSITSIQDALNTELARCKIEAGAVADKIQANLATLAPVIEEYPTMFPDLAQVVLKPADDVINLAASRVAAHKEAEAKRAEAKRLADEAAAKAADALQTIAASGPAAAPVSTIAPAPPVATSSRAKDPDEVLHTIANMVRAMSTAEQIEVLNFAIAVTTRRSKAA